jgi:hypothetical protein
VQNKQVQLFVNIRFSSKVFRSGGSSIVLFDRAFECNYPNNICFYIQEMNVYNTKTIRRRNSSIIHF